MNLRSLYQTSFPSPIARRMIEQSPLQNLDEDIWDGATRDKARRISGFAHWDETKEGHKFWLDISNLYVKYKEPGEVLIRAIFKLHKIPYE